MPTDDTLKYGTATANQSVAADVLLKKLTLNVGDFQIDNKEIDVDLQLTGVYNLQCGGGGCALVRQVAGPKLLIRFICAGKHKAGVWS